MLTVTTRTSRGFIESVVWYCDPCEVEVLQQRGVLPLENRQELVVRLTSPRGWTETLRHDEGEAPPICYGCRVP